MPGTRSSRPRGNAFAGDFGRGREMLPIAWRGVGDHAAGVPARRRDGRDTCCAEEHGAAARGRRATGAPGTTGSPCSARVRPARTASPTRPVTMPGTASTRVHDRPAQRGVQRDRRRGPRAGPRRGGTTAARAAPRRRRARARPTSTEPTRIVLSWVPKWAIAQFLTGVGVWSMTSSPTASTGDVAGSVSAATRWPTPVPARAARTPYRAKRSLEVTRGGSSREGIGMGG